MENITTPILPRYKVQFFQEVTLSWRDIQKTYDSLDEAKVAMRKVRDAKARIMVIEGKKRYVLQASEV